MVVLGMKELYGGGLFVRESNNTLIFVRSSYRVSRYTGGADYSLVRLDGLRDLRLPRLADFLMQDYTIRWFPLYNVGATHQQAAMQWVQKYAPLFGGDPQKYHLFSLHA